MTQANPFEALRPLLNAQVAKELDALNSIQARFPGKAWKEIAKEIEALAEKANGDMDSLVRRLSERVAGNTSESVSTLEKAVKKLSKADLVEIGKQLGLEFSGTKTQIVADLKRWLESGGEFRPKTAKELAAEKIAPLTSEWKELTRTASDSATTRLLNLIDRAAKLAKKDLEQFCESIDLPFSGTKPKIKKHLSDYVNRLSVSHVQTTTR